jgi:TetR/AcrR family transcriptional regulator
MNLVEVDSDSIVCPSMTAREDQRIQVRQRIIDAAVEVFAERGYKAGTQREVANRASLSQGLVTYHFPSKEALWEAAIDQLFASFEKVGLERLANINVGSTEEIGRQLIIEYVRVAAQHTNLFRMLVDDAHTGEARLAVIDKHLRLIYSVFSQYGAVLGLDKELIPHAFFAFAGAASFIFMTAHEFERVSGANPLTPSAIARHGAFLAQTLIPNKPKK